MEIIELIYKDVKIISIDYIPYVQEGKEKIGHVQQMQETYRNTQMKLQEMKNATYELKNYYMGLCSLDTTKKLVNLKIQQLKLSKMKK